MKMKMSKRALTFTLLAFFAIGLSTSCKKYEEGPLISLRTKEARLTNTWKVEKAWDEDGNKRDSTSSATQTFEEGGTYKTNSSFGTIAGKWDWADDKEAVEITISFFGQSNTQKWTILKLKKDELWVEDKDGAETHFVPE